MTRPRKKRFCRRYNADRVYKPQGIPLREIDSTIISLDQFEAIRLCDVENLDQEQAGLRMGISRGTVQRLLYEGRRLLAEAMIKNNAIVINLRESEESHVSMYTNQRRHRARRHRM